MTVEGGSLVCSATRNGMNIMIDKFLLLKHRALTSSNYHQHARSYKYFEEDFQKVKGRLEYESAQ